MAPSCTAGSGGAEPSETCYADSCIFGSCQPRSCGHRSSVKQLASWCGGRRRPPGDGSSARGGRGERCKGKLRHGEARAWGRGGAARACAPEPSCSLPPAPANQARNCARLSGVRVLRFDHKTSLPLPGRLPLPRPAHFLALQNSSPTKRDPGARGSHRGCALPGPPRNKGMWLEGSWGDPAAAPGHVFVPTPRRMGPCGQIGRRIPSCRTDGQVWILHRCNGRAPGTGMPSSASPPAAPAVSKELPARPTWWPSTTPEGHPSVSVTKKSRVLPRRAAGRTDNQRELRPALSTRASPFRLISAASPGAPGPLPPSKLAARPGVTAAEPGVTHRPGGRGWGAPAGPRHHPRPGGCAQAPTPGCEASPSPSRPGRAHQAPLPGVFSFPRPPRRGSRRRRVAEPRAPGGELGGGRANTGIVLRAAAFGCRPAPACKKEPRRRSHRAPAGTPRAPTGAWSRARVPAPVSCPPAWKHLC
ncbi:translation initiation factor IF-2-like [Cygnus olor]|uniref:translation initiation factor IF-2-like n=1 Tax=Cygnus olor TaxID=8869 RepID=UPI001ADE1420|nr:translation initiation factor IF-2-like [Cygnus olor]